MQDDYVRSPRQQLLLKCDSIIPSLLSVVKNCDFISLYSIKSFGCDTVLRALHELLDVFLKETSGYYR